MAIQMPTPFKVLDEGDTFETYRDQLRAYQEALISKWEWLLEGSEYDLKPLPKGIWGWMSILFENQQAVSRGVLREATQTTDLTLPEKYTLPIIRAVFPALLATKICSVQAMPAYSGGVGQIFWLDFLYEATGGQPKVDVMPPDSDYAQYDECDMENKVPKPLKMTIVSESITACKDILGATWSTEVQEDARNVLGLDVEQELVRACADEIVRELDYRILMAIWNGAAAGTTTWSYTLPEACDCAPKLYYETLAHAIIDASDDIYGNRYREADFIIAGRNVAKYLAKMDGYKAEPRAAHPTEGESYKVGVNLIGRLTGMWDVYKTPLLGSDHAIIGAYPRGMVDCGFIFAPYIPLTPMPLVYAEYVWNDEALEPGAGEPPHGAYLNTDKWTRNVRTRNAMKMVVPELYAKLVIEA